MRLLSLVVILAALRCISVPTICIRCRRAVFAAWDVRSDSLKRTDVISVCDDLARWYPTITKVDAFLCVHEYRRQAEKAESERLSPRNLLRSTAPLIHSQLYPAVICSASKLINLGGKESCH